MARVIAHPGYRKTKAKVVEPEKEETKSPSKGKKKSAKKK